MKRIKHEIYILIGIILIITFLEILTNCISNKSAENILGQMDKIKESLDKIEEKDESEEVKQALVIMGQLDNNSEEIDDEAKNIKADVKKLKDSWFKEEAKLSYFSEHDELEKITYAIVILEENVNNNEYEESLNNLIEAKFWLEHVKEKDSFKLKNIF